MNNARSSTRSRTKRRRSPPIRCCRSCRRSRKRRAAPSRRATSRSPDASWRSSPSSSPPGQRVERRPRGARRARQDARSEHHQAAEHQRLGAAAAGRDQGAAAAGLRRARLSRRSRAPTPRRTIKARYAKVLGSAVNPGAARRQLRPPRRGVRQAVREEAPALDGRAGARTRRRTSRSMGGGDFYGSEQSAVVAEGRQAHDRADEQSRREDRPQGRRQRQGRRRDRARRR